MCAPTIAPGSETISNSEKPPPVSRDESTHHVSWPPTWANERPPGVRTMGERNPVWILNDMGVIP